MFMSRFGAIAAFAAVTTLAAWAGNAASQPAATKGLVLYASHPTAMVDFYVKAGVAWWESKGSLSSITVSRFKDDGTEFGYGAGVQAHFGSLGARREYESFDIEDTDGIDLFSLVLTWTFL